MDTIKKLSDYASEIDSPIRFIGVPKTIDNDLEVTDHTPGFGSAAKYIASVTKEIIRDGLVYDIKNVTIIEIMGRNAGWLTGAAALATCEDCEGVDAIYLPERRRKPLLLQCPRVLRPQTADMCLSMATTMSMWMLSDISSCPVLQNICPTL